MTQLPAATAEAPTPRDSLTQGQSAYLDFLRGVSAQLVLVGHLLIAFASPGPILNTLPHSLGVVVFFLLSGYLISLTTFAKLRRGAYGLRDFTIDRAARIFTPYVPALAFVAIVDRISSLSPAYPFARDYNILTGLLNLLMLQDHPIFLALRRLGWPERAWIFGPFGSGRPFWTVMIEWWIYLAFGFAVFVLWRGDRPRGMARLALGLALLVVPGFHFVAGFGQCLTMIWCIGMALALAHEPLTRAIRAAVSPRLLVLAAIVLLILCAVRLGANQIRVYELQFAFYVSALLFVGLHWIGRTAWQPGVRLDRLARGLAAISYSLYLTHFTLLILVATLMRAGYLNGRVAIVLCFVAANAFAVLFWWLFERHHRRMAQWLRRVALPIGARTDPQVAR